MDAHHHHPPEGPEAAELMAEMLDLADQVLHGYLSDAIGWVRDLASDRPARRILDLGSGTGAATIALARAFPDADVLAVDSSTDLLGRVKAKARDLGLGDRVLTLQADLDGPWPAMEATDVVWASMSIHHLVDPDRVLADIHANSRSGGICAIAESDTLPRFLPDDIGVGQPGLEARCHAALAETRTHQFPHLGSDWGPRLSGAGFTAITARVFAIDLNAPLPSPAGRFAQTFLQRLRTQLDGTIAPDDLAVRATRTIWVGTRP